MTYFIKVSGEEVKIGTVLFDYDKKSNDGISLRKNEKVMVSNKTFKISLLYFYEGVKNLLKLEL